LIGFGAKSVLDYTAGPVTDQVRAAYPDGVDAVIDLVAFGHEGLPLSAVRDGGMIASTLGAADERKLADAGLSGANVMASPVREVVGPLADQAAAGTLTVDVARVLPFEQATDGLAVLAGGRARGKIVVRVEN
jgi:NADPH-dependent curcumin reductase CurA